MTSERHVARPLALALVALAAVLALAACGGSDSPEVASLGGSAGTEEGETTAASDDPEEAILAFTSCMREEGIDIPDPDVSGTPGQGRIQIGPGGIDPNDPDFQAAQETCGVHLAGIQGTFDPEQRQEFQDAALELAQCLRDQGLDVPDPDFSGQGPGPGGGGGGFFGGNLDPGDPDVQAAMEECGDILGDRGFGGPGGPPAGQEDGQ